MISSANRSKMCDFSFGEGLNKVPLVMYSALPLSSSSATSYLKLGMGKTLGQTHCLVDVEEPGDYTGTLLSVSDEQTDE